MNHGLVNLLVRWLVLALGVALSARIVPGISYDSGSTLAFVVVLLSLFNAVLRPLLLLFTLPFIILTLGLGIWVINALLFLFVGKIVDGFAVSSIWAALGGAAIVSITNFLLSRFLKPAARPAATQGGGAEAARPVTPLKPVKPAKKDDVIDI